MYICPHTTMCARRRPDVSCVLRAAICVFIPQICIYMSSYYSICVLTGDQTFSVWSARLSYVPPSEWDLSYIKVRAFIQP